MLRQDLGRPQARPADAEPSGRASRAQRTNAARSNRLEPTDERERLDDAALAARADAPYEVRDDRRDFAGEPAQDSDSNRGLNPAQDTDSLADSLSGSTSTAMASTDDARDGAAASAEVSDAASAGAGESDADGVLAPARGSEVASASTEAAASDAASNARAGEGAGLATVAALSANPGTAGAAGGASATQTTLGPAGATAQNAANPAVSAQDPTRGAQSAVHAAAQAGSAAARDARRPGASGAGPSDQSIGSGSNASAISESNSTSGSTAGSTTGSTSGSHAGSASAASAASANSANAARDPLARLLDSAQSVLRNAGGAMGSPVDASGGAIAGRLAEIETGIARTRAAESVAATGAELSVQGASAAQTARIDASVGIAMGGGGLPTAGAAAGPVVAGVAFDGATSAALSLAGDLAPAGDDSVAPAAHLAAKGAGILASQRGGAITMRLEPPALGQLRIELQISQGAVVADFTAATPEARVLLEANLGMLRERLESQGLSVDRLTVHGGGRGTESAPVAAGQGAGDARQQSNDGADARSRGDRGEARQDAAGGESRGRRDGDARDSNEGRRRTDAQASAQGPRGFAGVLQAGMHGTDAVRRAG